MANEKRLIDANEVIRETESIINFRKQHYMPTEEYEALLGYLNKRPTVDAVEVVRCKDCKYSEWDCDCGFYLCLHGCDWNKGDHFCSYGERKDNG